MSGWDLYCALCSTETGTDLVRVLGSTNPAMLAIRRRVMLALKEKVKRGEVTYPRVDFYDNASKDLNVEGIDWDWASESCAYDPTLVGEGDAEWQGDVCCFGLNVKTNMAYMSGPARHTDSGHVSVTKGNDPNEPVWEDGDEPLIYWTLDAGDPVLFPTHRACRGILQSALGASGVADVDNQALYEAMCLLSTMFQAHLTIDYGDIRGNAVHWSCIPGEEYLAIRPEISPEAMAVIHSKISSGALRHRDPLSRQPNLSDPFGILPTELLCRLALYLPFTDLKSLLAASAHVTNATNGDAFWKRILRCEMEWTGLDLDSLSRGRARGRDDDVDCKALFLWLEEVTRPVFAVEPPWLGAANRRRIWGACGQVADVYWERKVCEVKEVE